MYKNDFLKVACVTSILKVANPAYNVDTILNIIKDVNSSIAVFPELSISSYTCNDLFYQNDLIDECLEALNTLLTNNPYKGLLVVGMPLDIDGVLYNCAIVIQGADILGVVPKIYLPNTGEFYEKRWFRSARDIIKYSNISIGIEICEDMWAPITLNSKPSVTIIIDYTKFCYEQKKKDKKA